MLFNEFYGCYYRAVTQILREATQHPVSKADITRISQAHVPGYAWMNISDALTKYNKKGWYLLDRKGNATIRHEPQSPLTLLERRWLKAISLDPRVQLFDVDLSFVGDVEPLFLPEDIICFDCYGDGDDYADATYQQCFRTLLQAINEERTAFICYTPRKAKKKPDASGAPTEEVTPLRLEYSEKDDRFRLICAAPNGVVVRNMEGISACRLGEKHGPVTPAPVKSRTMKLRIIDRRNALERASMHFTHLQKKVEMVDDHTFLMELTYDASDEAEMIIRVLQFGPSLEVLAPERLRKEVQRRVQVQKALLGMTPGADA